MLKRIVRMEFQPEKVQDFLQLFSEVQDKIAAQEGCAHVELCKDATLDHVYYTYSLWDEEADLERYRHSELFKSVWSRTKALFGGKPQAFSLVEPPSD